MLSKYCWYRVKYCLTGMNEYTRSNAHTQILRTVKDFPRILSSWTRKSRNGVHFPESSAERFTFFTSLRSSGPFLTAFPRILKLNSGSQGRRPFQQTSARLVPSPLRCLFPMIRPWAFALVSWSWTRHRRNGVRFPKYPHGCSSRLRYSGPTFHFWTRWLVSLI